MESGSWPSIDIMVNGGGNVSHAGAGILVPGSFLFQFPDGVKKGIQALLVCERLTGVLHYYDLFHNHAQVKWQLRIS